MHWIRKREPHSDLVPRGLDCGDRCCRGQWDALRDAVGTTATHKSPCRTEGRLCNQREGPAWHPGKETNDTALGVDENSHFWLFQPCLGPMRALSRATGRPLTLGVQLFL